MFHRAYTAGCERRLVETDAIIRLVEGQIAAAGIVLKNLLPAQCLDAAPCNSA
jgi:hypothetical protein